jgi:hypothetical protein
MPNSPIAFSRRPHREGDDVLLLDLLRAGFGTWPKVEIQCEPIDHLRWKCSNKPESPGLHRITEVDGQAVSSVFCWVQQVKVGDRWLRNIQGTDRVVHPGFQRRGMGEAITRWRSEHPDDQPCDFQFGPRSGHPAMIRLSERAKQRARSFELGNRIRVLTLPLVDDAGEPVDPPLAASAIGGEIRAVERFDSRMDTFSERASHPYQFFVERGSTHLNWRYADPRAGRFAIRYAEQDGALVGFSVLRISFDRGYIADLLALPDRLDVAAALLDEAIAHLAATHVRRIDWWVNVRHPYQQLARERGFFDKRVVDISCFPHNPALDLSFLTDPSVPAHIAAGDTDLV